MADLVRRSRVVALILGVLAFAGGAWLRAAPPNWIPDLSVGAQLAIVLLSFAVFFVGLPLVHIAVFWRSCRRPVSGFLLGRYAGKPAFAAPVTPLVVGPMFILQFVLIGYMSARWTDAWAHKSLRLFSIAVVGFAVVLTVLHVLLLFRPPRLRLTEDGLVITTPRSTLLPWETFAPSGPTPREVHRRSLWPP